MIKYLAMIAAWVGEKDLALRTACHCRPYPTSGLTSLWRIETDAVVGPAARRSVLRKNRRLASAEVISPRMTRIARMSGELSLVAGFSLELCG